MTETYYMEVHKAKEQFKIVDESMSLIRKLGANEIIKKDLLLNLNKIKQYLMLSNLKILKEENNV